MKSLDLKPFYAQSLGIAAPWNVTDVVFDGDHKLVTVFVECASGLAWADPGTGKRAGINDRRERTWRHLYTCQFQTIVTARVPRLLLKNGKSIIASVPWAQRSARVTRALESLAIDALLNCRTVRTASRLTGLGEDQLDEIMARAVRDGLERHATLVPTLLGIDEPERSGDRLPPSSRRSVKAMDISSACVSAAQAVLPEAVIVFDSFHVANHLNKAADTVRRQEHARLRRSGDDTLKGTRYQWLRTYADLRRQEARDFRRLLRQDLRTAKAWALKENFRRIWSYRSVAGAMRFAHDWAGAAAHAGLRPMIKAAETVKRHLWGIAGFVTHPITNAATEGVNSMIQSLRSLLKNPVWLRGDEFFRKARRNKGEGRDLRLRRNEALWNKACRPQGIPSPRPRHSRSSNHLNLKIRGRVGFFNRLLGTVPAGCRISPR